MSLEDERAQIWRAIQTNGDRITELSEGADRLQAIEERLDKGSRRMDLFADELKRNTEVTEDVREILTAARMGLKVIGGLGAVFKWVGTLAGAAVAIYAAAYALTHGGVPPK